MSFKSLVYTHTAATYLQIQLQPKNRSGQRRTFVGIRPPLRRRCRPAILSPKTWRSKTIVPATSPAFAAACFPPSSCAWTAARCRPKQLRQQPSGRRVPSPAQSKTMNVLAAQSRRRRLRLHALPFVAWLRPASRFNPRQAVHSALQAAKRAALCSLRVQQRVPETRNYAVVSLI